MSLIMLSQIFPIENIDNYSVHFAQFNGEVEPLNEWVADSENLKRWNESKPGRGGWFGGDHIFTLMKFYPEAEDIWLFGGVFEIISRQVNSREVRLTEQGECFIGRLKLRLSHYLGRPIRPRLKTYYDDFEVSEILHEPYPYL